MPVVPGKPRPELYMFRRSIKYSLICGVFIVVAFVVAYTMDGNPFIDFSHLLFDVFIFGIFAGFAMYEYKIYVNQGYLKFWEGMSLGFLVYTPAAILFGVLLAIFFAANPDALTEYKLAAQQFLQDDKAAFLEKYDEARYLQEQREIAEVTSSGLVINSVLKKIISGFFVTPVISIILRKNKT